MDGSLSMLELGYLLTPVVRGPLLMAVAVLWTVLLVRSVGLRAFSKMTSFDFVTTVATGSLIAQAATRSRLDEFVQALAAIAGVFLIQWVLAKSRHLSDLAHKVLTNEPVVLMEHGAFVDAALKETRLARSSVLEKLRSAGVTHLSSVRAVVLETTGDISVIQGEKVDETLMNGVRRVTET